MFTFGNLQATFTMETHGACPTNTYGIQCASNCTYNTTNTLTRDTVNGSCICKNGWNGTECREDIDECENSTICAEKSTCRNLIGSYSCDCNAGFFNSSGQCDACSTNTYGIQCASNCTCNTTNTLTCDSVNGSCICENGWNGTECSEDIDECENSTICAENSTCNNSPGSYSCDCNVGFFNSSGQCDACPEGTFGQECKSNCTCNTTNTMTCDKVNGSCTCKNGWNGTICGEDIDECQKTTVCANIANSTCNNTLGSYSCDCVPGFYKSGDVCYAQDCPVGQHNCTQLCTKTSSTTFTCFCLPGYSLNSDGVTCDVCRIGTYGPNCALNCTCNTTNTLTCDKVNGSCTCKSGWNGVTCEMDINECLVSTTCTANSTCNNSLGSYTCDCNIGFINSGGKCHECNEGTYGHACASNCTCNTFNTLTCDSVNGSCTCQSGWNGTTCSEDIDECLNSTICEKNSTCNNLPGTYSCDCNVGFFNSSGQCIECKEGTFGHACTSNCTCNTSNTLTCDKVNGLCTCKHGWNGNTCSDDVDECQNSAICAAFANSACNNLPGTYSCDCNAGFFNSSGQCHVCSNNTYGIACTSNCTCNTTNVLTCDKVNGTCTCKNGWSGLTCDDDVDECQSPFVCDAKPDSTCANFPGYYFCACNSGFYESDDLCEANDKFQNYSVSVRFDVSVDFSLNNKKDPRYIMLLKSIQKTLAEHFSRSMGTAFYSIRVVRLRNGSVIADTELQVNKDKTDNPDGQVAKGLEDLASSPSLTVNGTVWNISEVKYNNKTVTVSQNLCDTFYQVTSCSDGQVCDDSDSVPKCRPIKDSNYQLIIGLSVGIPLFIVLVIIITVCVVYIYKRRRSAYDRPNKRREDNPEYSDLHIPERVARTQGESTPQYNTVRTVGEVYAEIGHVPDYFPTSHMSEHDYLRPIPLDTYSHGISTNITSQPNFRSGRSPALDARSATSRENNDRAYLHPTSTIYERNGVPDLNYDSLRPVYYPTRPPTRNATNDREHRNYGGRRPTTHNIHRAHYK